MNHGRRLVSLLAVVVCGCLSTVLQAAPGSPPRVYGIEAMPRVDVHIHLRGDDAESAAQYVAIMDKVGLDVAVSLSASDTLLDHWPAIRDRHAGRILFAPRPGERGQLWGSDEKLDSFQAAGLAGTKIWIGYNPAITEPELSESLAHQGRLGLPAIGMHIGDPPAGKTSPEQFQQQIENAIQLVKDNPETTFIMAHGFWLMTGDVYLEQLDQYFETYPNLHVDLSATAQAFGGVRLSRDKLRAFMIKWKDRILFGTDSNPEYALDERLHFYWYRVLETDQHHLRGFFGGEIDIQGLALPLDVLNHIYWWNAARLVPGVREALLARGYEIDTPAAHTPPPAITDARIEPAEDDGQVRLIVATDRPAEVRWSFSNLPYVRMSPERQLAQAGSPDRYEATLHAAPGRQTVYVSAADASGLSMTTATPVTFGEAAAEADAARPASLGYDVVAMEDFGTGHVDAGYTVTDLKQPFRETYIRFRARMASTAEPAPLWTLAYQPNPAYEPEQRVTGMVGEDRYTSVIDIQEQITLSDANPVRPGQWQTYEIRLDLNKSLYEVRVDGEVVTTSANRHMAGMWGGGLDTIALADPAAGDVLIDDVLVLTGPGSYVYEDDGQPDRSAPVLTRTLPADGSVSVDPMMAIAVGFTDTGLGLDAGAVVLELNREPVEATVLGRLHHGYVVFHLPEGFPPGKVQARIRLADMARPANVTEKSWSFVVADEVIAAAPVNLARDVEPGVDSVYPDRRDPYVAASLTDGQIRPQGGSPATWASGGMGRHDQWVELDFGQMYDVSKIRVHPVINRGVFITPRVLVAEAWDGEEYVPQAAVYTPDPAANVSVRFPAVRTQKVRMLQPPFMGSPHYSILWLTEVEAFGPSQSDDASDEQ